MVGIVVVPDEQPTDEQPGAEQPGAELVDLIDDADRVVGVVTRAEMRARRLLHRSVSIAVLSSDGRLLVHRRSLQKDLWPGRWDIAAGGVVASGETYDESARRELAEELGVDPGTTAGGLVELGEGTYRDADVALRCRCFAVVHDGPFTFDDGEVTEVRWMELDELDMQFAAGASSGVTGGFVPDSLAVTWPLVRPLMSRAGDAR